MIKIILLFASTALLSLAGVPDAVSVESSNHFRESLKSSIASVYEGLLGPFEREIYEKESKRNDVTVFRAYRFYTPAIQAKPPSDLIALLGSSKTIEPYSGLKRCGGFHPDYCVAWEKGTDTFYAMICFGCGELIFVRGAQKLHYDLSTIGMESLKKHLKIYDSKRPKPIP